MADPVYLHSVMSSLPNVDPDSDAVKAAIGQATQKNSGKSGNSFMRLMWHTILYCIWQMAMGI